jgi:uncharacterized protein
MCSVPIKQKPNGILHFASYRNFVKTTIITGASSGVGAALALHLASLQHQVVLVARRKQLLDNVAAECTTKGATCAVIEADVSVESECLRVVGTTLDTFGTVDYLVNNAGRGHCANVEQTTTEVLNSMMSVNLYSTFWLTQQVLPTMIANNAGHIVNIASVAGKQGFPFNAAYVAAKHAVVGFTASLRAELYGTNVYATAICPAGIQTSWAAVTEGQAIGAVFAKGIQYSRTIAKERGLPLSPLTPLLSAESIAARIAEVLAGERSDDVFTHAGTEEHAAMAATKRTALEDQFAPLFLGMQKAYEE